MESTPSASSNNDVNSRLDDISNTLVKFMHSFDSRMRNIENEVFSKSGTPKINKTSRSDSEEFEESLPNPLTAWMPRYDDPGIEIRERVKEKSRKSMFEKLAEAADKPMRQFETVQNMPSFDHIALNELTIPSCIKFFNDVHRYQSKHKVSLPVATLLSDEVIEHLVSRNRNIDEAGFYDLKVSELVVYIRKYLLPTDVLYFSKLLAKNLNFKIHPSYVPSPTNFPVFYRALLLYRKKFMFLFLFMSENNSPRNIPSCDNKPGGLIFIFASKIPFGYGSAVVRSFGSKRFDNINDFIEAFYNVAMVHHDNSLKARETVQYFDNTLRSNVIDTPRKSNNVNFIHDDFNTSVDEDELLFSETYGREESYNEEDLEDFSNSAKSDFKEVTPIVHFEEDVSNINNNSNYSKEKFRSLQVAPNNSKHGSTPTKNEVPNGCFNVLLFGKCTKAACSYSHDRQDLVKSHAFYLDRLKKSEYSPTIPSKSLSSISNISDHVPLLRELFLNAIPEACILEAVKVPAELIFENGDHFDISKDSILLDSGALSASYISKHFANKFRDRLTFFSAHSRVNLATKNASACVNECCELRLVFTASNGMKYNFISKYLILDDLSHDIIIGLPDIVIHLSEFFKERIDVALDSHRNKLININSSDSLLLPWSIPPALDAPEDLEAPLPCSFSYALHFMEMTHDEATKEFFSQFEEHVSAEFKANTNVIDLLKQKGLLVFVPSNWEGIRGLEPLEFSWKPNLPAYLKPRARPVSPRLFEHTKVEFNRLRKYFYRESNSNVASCLVIAPKATPPFIRLCGDYVTINQYIEAGHYPIKRVLHLLERVAKFPIKMDIDMTNSYHQILLAHFTSEMLSVQTPWGQFAPLFMPEGVSPGSGTLQKIVDLIFQDFIEEDWCIAIFDNILLLAEDYTDAYFKLNKFLDRCIERNIVLKFSKTWLGFEEVNFFGYVCKHKTFELSQKRKDAIMEIPFPSSLKNMQSFLGAAIFFKDFVHHFSDYTAPLHDMVRKDFDWNSSTWTKNYPEFFDLFKKALVDAVALHYPDYELDWLLQVDASDIAVSSALWQITSNSERQLLGLASQKFSQQASHWPTYEKEMYAIFFGVKTNEYYLRGKSFVIETDHRNLQWMETSVVPKVIRWRVYLQNFNFMIRHIPGKENVVADWLSRPSRTSVNTISILAPDTSFGANVKPFLTPESLLEQVHGGRVGHMGTRSTWLLLNKQYPGHKIPYRFLAEYIATCPVCQKDRLGMTDSIEPIVRHLKFDHRRSVIGSDFLTISPPSKNGNVGIIVIVNLFTHLCSLTVTKDKSALSLAQCLFKYFAHYGAHDILNSDPGSDLMSNTVAQLNKWLGQQHRVSLVDRHESNGVEGSNKQILRHLKSIVYDERIKSSWDNDDVIFWIQFVLNSAHSSETGTTPFLATFGSVAQKYLTCPSDLPDLPNLSKYIIKLDNNLKVIQDISRAFQHNLASERTHDTPTHLQNVFQPGDFVLHHLSELPSKLTPRYAGPYEVLSQSKNDVTCRHLVQQVVRVLHVSTLKIFHGNRDAAFKAALLDFNQFVISKFIAYRGNPLTRTSMEFEICFEDGDVVWLPWSEDLFSTTQYEDFCRANPPLFPLLFRLEVANREIKRIRQSPITDVSPGDIVFVDLRSYGSTWYSTLNLPDQDHLTYVVEYRYTEWVSKSRLKIVAICPIFDETFHVDNFFIFQYGKYKKFDPSFMVMIDVAFTQKFPQVLPSKPSVTPKIAKRKV
jgi:hypothetical protein